MKKLLIATAAVAALLAGCGVDKEGTADNLIKDIEKQAGATLTADQKSCVTEVVKSYSDDELTQLSEQKAAEELTADFGTRIGTCLAGDLGTTDEGTEEVTEETEAG